MHSLRFMLQANNYVSVSYYNIYSHLMRKKITNECFFPSNLLNKILIVCIKKSCLDGEFVSSIFNSKASFILKYIRIAVVWYLNFVEFPIQEKNHKNKFIPATYPKTWQFRLIFNTKFSSPDTLQRLLIGSRKN